MTHFVRRALVTGAASGIGAATVELLARRGIHVLMADRDPTVVEKAGKVSGAVGYVMDLGREDEIVALADYAKQKFGGCDILINNAGIAPKKDGRGYKVTEIDSALWNQVMMINLTAPFLLCRELLPAMQVNKWGRVINVSSRAGRTQVGGVSSFYSASKAGLIGFTRQLANEYVADGVTVNCVAPGPVQTPLATQSSEAQKQRVLDGIPMKRPATAMEIAVAIDFLSTPEAAYVTGTCMDVNGGGYMA
ncbi:MAG: 3-oxoacyl-ACP reductase [Ferrovibrio sp.]|nr:MAG: 3-oxoacyl-ACP reductase [Ferrovibrio sp.]